MMIKQNQKKVSFLVFLMFVLLLSSPLFAQSALSDQLSKLINHEDAPPGGQVCLLEENGTFSSMSFGTRDVILNRQNSTKTEHSRPKLLEVTDETVFQIGALLTPFIAHATLDSFQQPEDLYKTVTNQVKTLPLLEANDVLIGDVLKFQMGIAPSKAAFSSTKPNNKNSYFINYLQKNLRFMHSSVSDIQLVSHSPEGYAWLLARLIENHGVDVRQISNRWFSKSCVNVNDCQDRQHIQAVPLLKSGDYIFPIDKSRATFIRYPSLSLYSTACSTLSALIKMSSGSDFASRMLVTKAPTRLNNIPIRSQLGGVTYGMYFLRLLEDKLIYYMDSRMPGSSALMLYDLVSDRGAVVLVNNNHPTFIYRVRKAILSRWEKHTAITLIGNDLLKQLEGFYRPNQRLPESYQWLSFLNDISFTQIEGELRGRTIFDNDFPLHLIPVSDSESIFMIHGTSLMDHWRIGVVKDKQGNIIGLDSDLIYFEKVHVLLSVWAIIFYLALVVFSPMLWIIIGNVIKRSTK